MLCTFVFNRSPLYPKNCSLDCTKGPSPRMPLPALRSPPTPLFSLSRGSPVVLGEGDTRLLLPQPGQQCSTLQLQPDQPCILQNILHQLPVVPQQHSSFLRDCKSETSCYCNIQVMREPAKTRGQPKLNHISPCPTLGKREFGSQGCFSQVCQVQSDKQHSLMLLILHPTRLKPKTSSYCAPLAGHRIIFSPSFSSDSQLLLFSQHGPAERCVGAGRPREAPAIIFQHCAAGTQRRAGSNFPPYQWLGSFSRG